MSARTKALLADRYEEALHDRAVATSTEVEGELRIFELTEAQKAAAYKILQISSRGCGDVLRSLAGVRRPARRRDGRSLLRVLRSEEQEVVPTRKERGAAVLTLDGQFPSKS